MLENEVVILNLKNGLYYVLNKTASEVWDLLFVTKLSIAKVISNLTHKYEINPNTIKKDINEQLDYWSKENIISA